MDKETKNLGYIILVVILILIFLIIMKLASGFSYDVSSLPFADLEDVVVNDTGNLSINCGICNFTSFMGFVNVSNVSFVSFDVFVPNGTPDGNYSDVWFLFSDFSNETLFFEFNVSVNATNASVNDTGNVSVNDTSVGFANISLFPSPVNNSKFGSGDAFPGVVSVVYDGFINFSSSNISLLFNNQSIPSIDFFYDNESFWFDLGEEVDGVYSGLWDLVDDNGSVLHYSYVFEVKTSPPINPRSVSPGKGQYTDDVLDLRVFMEAPTYTIYYIVSDGFPAIGAAGWNLMSHSGNQSSVFDLDFAGLDLGAVYLKIVDEFNNVAVYPTGIISAPMLEVDVDDRIRRADKGDTLNFDVSVRLKESGGDFLRCKLDDFIDMDSKKYDLETKEFWAVPNIAYLVFDDEEYGLDNEFDETIIINGDRSVDLELVIDVPSIAEKGEDYNTRLECIVTG